MSTLTFERTRLSHHTGLSVWQTAAAPRGRAVYLSAGGLRGVAMHPLDVNTITHRRDPHGELDALLAYLTDWIEKR